MEQKPQEANLGDEKRATEYLANERTFLAWIRTSIAIISLGFVVAKFSLWLNQLAAQLQPQMQAPHLGASMPIGVAMMALGGLLAILAAWRYHKVNRAIEIGSVRADRRLVIVVTVMVTLLCGALIVYMLTIAHAS